MEADSAADDEVVAAQTCFDSGDVDAARAIGLRVQTGTFFMNRCDYLDPALAWTGVKDSGRGCTLSSLGYAQLTRAKSWHLRLNT